MAAYTQCLRCAGAPRRPAGGSGLSLPFLLGMPLSMTPGSSIIASPELRCRRRLRRDLSGSALPILPQSVSRGPRISGLPDSRICYGLPSCSPPLYGSDRYTRPTRAFTSRLPAGRSPSPLLDMTTTATGLLCWRDSHPLEWQLASLHQIVPWSTLCRAPIYSPLFACDDCTFVDQFSALSPERSFFLETVWASPSRRRSHDNRLYSAATAMRS